MFDYDSIDWDATKEKMEIVNLAAWCRLNKFDKYMVGRMLNGRYPHLGGVSLRIIQKLYQDGYLVLKEAKEAA